MRYSRLLAVLSFCIFPKYAGAQQESSVREKYTARNKGKFFISYGGNRDFYSNSDINFRGDNYNFTLDNVEAHDKPKGYSIDYLNPGRMTIPQTNIRLGYFFADHYSFSIGLDHMKYVMYQQRLVHYNGSYQNEGTFGESAEGNNLLLTEDFLLFEHTDGLNYVVAECSRYDDVSHIIGITNTDLIQTNLTAGISGGMLYPKTNTTLMGMARHDDFHISGYGISAKAGLNVTFLKYFYLQGELKVGYINMPDIRTTKNLSDRASQNFFFF